MGSQRRGLVQRSGQRQPLRMEWCVPPKIKAACEMCVLRAAAGFSPTPPGGASPASMAATLSAPTSAFYVDVPTASGSSSSSPAATTASSNVLKRVASTGLDSASDAGTSVVPDSVDGEGDGEMADAVRAGEGDDAARETKRARRSDNGLEPVHYTPSESLHQLDSNDAVSELVGVESEGAKCWGTRPRRVLRNRRVLRLWPAR